MFIPLDRNNPLPIIKQLYNYLKASIFNGTLSADSKMPSTRSLSKDLQISRSTVVECYEQLTAEGYLYTKEASGTYVSPGITFKTPSYIYNLPASKCANSLYEEPEDFISFRAGVPDLKTIPIDTWGKFYREVTAFANPGQLDYNTAFGSWELRTVLANYLKRVRGVVTNPSNILITNGAAQSFSLLSELVEPEEFAAVEDPASIGMINTLERHKVRCHPIPIDNQGLVIDLLPKESPKLIFTTPSHQFPLGVVMSIRRRIDLICYAVEKDSYIIEDDYDSEFRYEGSPIQSMQNLAPEQVIYVGTFSKTLMPALRMGYMILPDRLIKIMNQHKYASDIHSPILEQMTMAKFIQEGMLDRHIKRMTRRYGSRRELLVRELKSTFGKRIDISGDSGGLHLVLAFKNMNLPTNLSQRLLEEKVQASIVSDCCIQNNSIYQNQLILGFGNIQDDEIIEGIKRLNRALTN